MICPHCKKAVSRDIPKEKVDIIRSTAEELRSQGFSHRDIQMIIFLRSGFQVAHTTIGRWLAKRKK